MDDYSCTRVHRADRKGLVVCKVYFDSGENVDLCGTRRRLENRVTVVLYSVFEGHVLCSSLLGCGFPLGFEKKKSFMCGLQFFQTLMV